MGKGDYAIIGVWGMLAGAENEPRIWHLQCLAGGFEREF